MTETIARLLHVCLRASATPHPRGVKKHLRNVCVRFVVKLLPCHHNSCRCTHSLALAFSSSLLLTPLTIAMTHQRNYGPRDCVLYAESVRLRSKLMFTKTTNTTAIKAEYELMSELSSSLSQLKCSDADDKTNSTKRTKNLTKRTSTSVNVTASCTPASRKKRKRQADEVSTNQSLNKPKN